MELGISLKCWAYGKKKSMTIFLTLLARLTHKGRDSLSYLPRAAPAGMFLTTENGSPSQAGALAAGQSESTDLDTGLVRRAQDKLHEYMHVSHLETLLAFHQPFYGNDL
jgi:hypothetical protein